jgi:drug/metabolite transporter (DMT)-like permease
MKNDRTRVLLALLALYFIWGSTYLAIRIALEGIPPLLVAGVRYVIAGAALRGERLVALPPPQAVGALAYLIVFGSIIAYSAYQFLLKTVRPTLAASYSYVNPIVALALGALVMGEAIPPRAIFALGMILGGVALLALRGSTTVREAQVESPADG